ncbi:MAG: hypothetical protein AAFQ37_00625, partial [Bacteroidota bacterium]
TSSQEKRPRDNEEDKHTNRFEQVKKSVWFNSCSGIDAKCKKNHPLPNNLVVNLPFPKFLIS